MSKPLRLPPGIHYDVPAAAYHADPCEKPSLSSSIAKVILEKTPKHAWIAHPRLNPDFKPPAAPKFNLGSVVHELMLGKGLGFDIVLADDYRTKAAQASRQKILDNGQIPVLGAQAYQAETIADFAIDILNEMGIHLADNRNEAVLIWDMHGLPCRAMVDSIDEKTNNIYDIKTTAGGLPDYALMRTIVNFGYDLSAAFYIKGMTALFPELAGRFVFKWIFVETEEPYEIRVIEADATTLHFGDRKAHGAFEKWRVCMANNEWPGWPRVVTKSVYPAWAESAWLEREMEEAGIE
jgi:PDDEXK-like domain of unknown function (DUF3799)